MERSPPLSREYHAIYMAHLRERKEREGGQRAGVRSPGSEGQWGEEGFGVLAFGTEGELTHDWKAVLRELWDRGVREVKVFVNDALPGIEEAIRELFPGSKSQLCGAHTLRHTLSQVRKGYRAAMVEDLEAIYRVNTQKKGDWEALVESERR